MTVTLIKYPPSLLNKIGSYVCQAVIYIQQQQPELLLDKYRGISWRETSNQSRLKTKLIEVISNAKDWESLINQVEVFIQTLLISDSTNTPVLIKLLEKIRHLNPNISQPKPSSERQDINSSGKESLPKATKQKVDGNQKDIKENESIQKEPTHENQQDINSTESIQKKSSPTVTESETSEKQQDINSADKNPNEPHKALSVSRASLKEIALPKAIAALLLDAENIQITPETEQFLTENGFNSIQIKIAFANWQGMGKKDVEFHNRGYDLIHVPRGKENAEGKMIAFGSIIDEYYPKVKEVLVCSSNNVMTHLCDRLQQKGLTVYQLSQESSNLTILNGKTNETQNHTILPSIEKLLSQIKEIIKEQVVQTSNQWIKLSIICKLYKEKYNFGVNKVISHHLPGKNVKNIFVNKSEFVIHQIPEHPEIYVAIFKMPTLQEVDNNIKLLTFGNKSELEQALIKIITNLVGKTPDNYIPIYTVGERFDKKYGKAITKILKELNMSGNLVNFLQSCNSFKLKKTGNIWQVAASSVSVHAKACGSACPERDIQLGVKS
ncbi:MAG: NYN domain-containing protein [Rivularia sp. (in: cyanobacteria)]